MGVGPRSNRKASGGNMTEKEAPPRTPQDAAFLTADPPRNVFLVTSVCLTGPETKPVLRTVLLTDRLLLVRNSSIRGPEPNSVDNLEGEEIR